MSLMTKGNEQGTGAVAGVEAKAKAPASAADVEAKKAKKKETERRIKERKRAAKKQQYEDALKLRDELQKSGLFDKLSDVSKNLVKALTVDPAQRVATSFGGPSIFSTLFGPEPKVGQSVTLEDAFNKTYKGKSTLDMLVKKWADKGVIVECVINQQKMLATTYTIKALPSA